MVDLEAAAKWLSIRKDFLMKTLRESYRVNLDYVIAAPSASASEHHPKPHGGHNKTLVFMTPDCFKRMCMRSRGKKAEDVRTYFIQLESMVLKYKDQMMSGMRAEIDQLERNQRGIRSSRGRAVPVGGYIYIVRASERLDSVYNLGRTNDLHRSPSRARGFPCR